MNYTTQVVFRPTHLPLFGAEVELLQLVGVTCEGGEESGRQVLSESTGQYEPEPGYYCYVEENFFSFDPGELSGASEEARVLYGEITRDGALDLDGEDLALMVLQRVLGRMDAEVKWIEGEAAFTASRMANDAFGGVAYLITRDEIRVRGTQNLLLGWAHQIENGLEEVILPTNLILEARDQVREYRHYIEDNNPDQRAHQPSESELCRFDEGRVDHWAGMAALLERIADALSLKEEDDEPAAPDA